MHSPVGAKLHVRTDRVVKKAIIRLLVTYNNELKCDIVRSLIEELRIENNCNKSLCTAADSQRSDLHDGRSTPEFRKSPSTTLPSFRQVGNTN
jgi:hypothetical protein